MNNGLKLQRIVILTAFGTTLAISWLSAARVNAARSQRGCVLPPMKAAVLYRYERAHPEAEWLVYEDVPEPTISAESEVIIRIGAAGVCRADLGLVAGLWSDEVQVSLPHIPGHENAGWVEEVGSGVWEVEVGDPVIVYPRSRTERCKACRRLPEPGAGEELFPGIRSNGGYAEFMKTHGNTLVRLPSALAPMDFAPLADAGLTAYCAAKQAAQRLVPGDCVAVIGANGLGHLSIQALRILTAAKIIALDSSDRVLRLAERLGAHHTVKLGGDDVEEVLALTRGRGAEAVIDFIAHNSSVRKSLDMAGRGGVIYIAGHGSSLEIPTIDAIVSEKTIAIVPGGSYSELLELMVLAEQGVITVATHEYPLSSANSALHDLCEGKVIGRAVLIP